MTKFKKGFTIAELCIVMAVASIVASMTISFLVLYRNYTAKMETNTNVMTDISNLKTMLNEWLFCYDQTGWTIAAADTVLSAQKDGQTDTLTFADTDGKAILTWARNGAVQSTHVFPYLDTLAFSLQTGSEYGIVQCDASYTLGKKVQSDAVLLAVFSGRIRQRIS